jgi:hypothetical protein
MVSYYTALAFHCTLRFPLRSSTVSSAITRVLLAQICYKAIDEWVNFFCNAKFRMWVLDIMRFTDQCEDIRLDDGSNFSWSDPIFITRFSITPVLISMHISRYRRTDPVMHIFTFHIHLSVAYTLVIAYSFILLIIHCLLYCWCCCLHSYTVCCVAC